MEEHTGKYTAKAAYPYTTFDGRKEYGCLQCINLWFPTPEDVLEALKMAGVEHWVVCKDDIWDRNVILKSNSIAEAEYKEKKRVEDHNKGLRAKTHQSSWWKSERIEEEIRRFSVCIRKKQSKE